MVKAVVCGACGKMGKAIIQAIASSSDFELSGAIEAKGHPELGKDAGAVAGVSEMGVMVGSDGEQAFKVSDVLIDFTNPEATLEHLELASSFSLPCVVGTTGFSSEQLSLIEELSGKIPVLLSPNMSSGVNLLFYLVEESARILGDDFDLEVIEAHHRLKKDAPSGTAVRLSEILAKARGWDLDRVAIYERRGMVGERKREEIGIQSIRAGDIVGEHTVIFGGLGERLELTHRAHSRLTFAYGALRAARFIVGKRAGLYSMRDCLGF